MGQDRTLSESEKLVALRIVQEYRDRWEALEKENLESDVQGKIERAQYTQQYKDAYENMDNQEMERIVEDAVQSALPDEG